MPWILHLLNKALQRSGTVASYHLASKTPALDNPGPSVIIIAAATANEPLDLSDVFARLGVRSAARSCLSAVLMFRHSCCGQAVKFPYLHPLLSLCTTAESRPVAMPCLHSSTLWDSCSDTRSISIAELARNVRDRLLREEVTKFGVAQAAQHRARAETHYSNYGCALWAVKFQMSCTIWSDRRFDLLCQTSVTKFLQSLVSHCENSNCQLADSTGQLRRCACS